MSLVQLYKNWNPKWSPTLVSNWDLYCEILCFIAILIGFTAVLYQAHNTKSTVPVINGDKDKQQVQIEIDVYNMLDGARVAKKLAIAAFALYCVYFVLFNIAPRVLKIREY